MEVGTSYARGKNAEALALQYLKKQGLKLVAQNYVPPGRGMADLDLIMQAKDGTLIFIEVKSRKGRDYGGAAASVSLSKQKRLILSAQHYLMQLRVPPVCRFDVILWEGDELQHQKPVWIQGAFVANIY